MTREDVRVGVMCLVVLGLAVVWSITPASAEPAQWSVSAVIVDRAKAHGVSSTLMLCMADRESNLNPLAVGDHGTSYGLFQIHEYGLLHLFRQQGYGSVWSEWDSADFTGRAIADGRGRAWTGSWFQCGGW